MTSPILRLGVLTMLSDAKPVLDCQQLIGRYAFRRTTYLLANTPASRSGVIYGLAATNRVAGYHRLLVAARATLPMRDVQNPKRGRRVALVLKSFSRLVEPERCQAVMHPAFPARDAIRVLPPLTVEFEKDVEYLRRSLWTHLPRRVQYDLLGLLDRKRFSDDRPAHSRRRQYPSAL
jgi:hypothetical protein